jgi:RNA polymerase sigma factor (sigma-70 family)
MPGVFRTANIGKYLKDMGTVTGKYDDQAFAKVNTQFADLYDRWQNTSDKKEKIEFRKRLDKMLVREPEMVKQAVYNNMPGSRKEKIESCLKLVYSLAKFYLVRSKNERVNIDDLIQAGNLGLVIAADKYLNTPVESGTRPAKFSTYAYFWIQKYITEESYMQATLMSGTRDDKWQAAHYTHTVGSDAYGETGDSDRKSEKNSVWDKLNSSEQNEIQTAKSDLDSIKLASKQLFKDLKPEEKRVLFLVYGIDTPTGNPCTYEEAGKLIGKSKATICRMMESSLWRVQNSIKQTGNAKDLLATLSLLQGVDISKIPDWNMLSTY